MFPILTDLTSDEVARAIEQNGTECCLSWAKWPEMELYQNDKMAWTLSDIEFPFFNNVFNSRLAKTDVSEVIEQTIAVFRHREVPMFWWTGPATTPEGLGVHLLSHGLVHGFQASAMAIDLDLIRECDLPRAIVTEEVLDTDALREWSNVMTPIYEFPEFAAAAWLRMLSHLGVGTQKNFRHFIARVDNRPVATASIYFGAGVAGVSSVGTLPEYRHRGIGTAVTLAALRAAREAGYRIGALFASPSGETLYKKIGFKEYGKGDCYLWSPDSEESA